MENCKEIAPRIDENGEPVCSNECPRFADPSFPDYWCHCASDGEPCPFGLRRQRDEARRELCEALDADDALRWAGKEDVAASRGWGYLYEAEKK